MKYPHFNANWSDEVKAIYKHDIQEMWDKNINRHIYNQYQSQIKNYIAIAKSLSPTKILDIGCAQGTLALLLAEHGYEVTAMDIRQEFINYAKTRYEKGNINFIRFNILEDEWTGSCDLIYFNQVIEHIVYPKPVLGKLRDWISEEGHIVITTPNQEYIRNQQPNFSSLGDVRNWEHMQSTADGDGHFFAYTLDELCEVVEGAGLNIVEAGYFESPIISGHMKLRFFHHFMPFFLLRYLDAALVKIPAINRRLCHQLIIVAKPA